MLDKVIIAFFMFGCWAKYIPGTLGFLGYNIWFVIALFWIVLNGLGVFNFFVNKNAGAKAFERIIDTPMENRWVAYNLVALISFCAADCWGMAFAFFMTSCLFMTLILVSKKTGK